MNADDSGHRKTKIVATVGPASWDPGTLVELVRAGVDVFRLNFSHADADRHARTVGDIRDAAAEAGREVAVLGDLPGPKLRVGEFPEGVVELVAGSEVRFTSEDVPGDSSTVPVSWPAMADSLGEGDIIYLADGAIRLKVLRVEDRSLVATVQVGGALSSHKGMNLPGVESGLDATSDADLAWVDFAVANGIDLLAVSFVRRASDLDQVKRRLEELGSNIPILAKIEKPQAAERAEEIIEAATGGIMVARGDLGIEVPLSRVPILQKRLIRAAGKHSKPCITATQMLASMVTNRRPTRAEVTDVATAIFDGTDAVMLSEETAVGAHPVEAVQVMDRIARATEPDLSYGEWLFSRTDQDGQDVSESVAQSAVGSVYRLNLSALVVPTGSGRTARLVSAHRPQVPVLGVSGNLATVRRLNLMFGVIPYLDEQSTEIRDLLQDCADLACRSKVAKSGDLIAIVAGLPDQELGTNLFEVHRVP